MNDRQENELSMFKAVQQVLNDNGATIASIVAFQVAKNDFDNAVTSIESSVQIQLKKITGTSADKEQAATAAIDMALALIGPAKSYATATSNNTLYEIFNYSPSALKRQRDTELVNTLTILRDNLQANGGDLADYGITAIMITNFAAVIATYNTLSTAPRNAISTKAAATKAIKEGFKSAKTILAKRIDGFVDAQKTTNPDFYNAYKSARVVVDNKGKTKKQTQPTT